MKIIKRGAEAIIYLEKEQLVKERVKKGYRIKEIDEPLRKGRTRKEARLINEARRVGVETPQILDIDEKNFKIIMEFLDGERLKELLNKTTDNNRRNLMNELGREVGKLHSAGIVHGDLTTSNLIFKDNKIYFIDFGLGEFSSRLEDLATDLSVLKEALKSTHFKYLEMLWESFIKGYRETFSNHAKVLKVLEDIGMRGRYVKRD